MFNVLIILFIKLHLIWNIGSFRCTAKWFVYLLFFSVLFQDSILKDIEHSSLCYSVNVLIFSDFNHNLKYFMELSIKVNLGIFMFQSKSYIYVL